ncbi:MAG TPA: HAMP domain-containing protein, partial [Thermoanaerobaculia bacterium]|nr:HAMP domain-containing protein [Thermoanaerobaculia bacterium]
MATISAEKATNGRTPRAPRPPGPDTVNRRQLLAALRALRRGDFEVRLPDDLPGVDGQICEAFNDVVALISGIGDEVNELRDAVREGRTRKRLRRGESRGGWSRYVGSVNTMLDDLTTHTDEIARVVQAVSRGDLTQELAVEGVDEPLAGDFLKHAKAVNDMVAQLSRFGSEVTRVAREVGVQGKLGAQAEVPGVSGVWKELTDSVNLMASNLTAQVREIARVTTAVAQGDLTKTVTIEVRGEILELKNTINTMVDQLSSFADEVTRVAREVGTEGELGGQAQVRGVSGVWRELTENVNFMAANLTNQVRNVAEVTTAVATGDLSKKITAEVKGEMLELKNTINTMVDQLSSFAAEVARVAYEVGTEGKLGGQAQVRGMSGSWKDLTESVNTMAYRLTAQVRDIALV